MRQQGRWPRRLSFVSLAALCLTAGPGCLRFVHSLDLPPKEQIAQGETIPTPSRNHVHVFLIHGMDPFDLANLNGLTEYIQQLGYIKTHYGQMYHLWEFKKEMRKVHEQDPQARFVLIGFSFGANLARELANAVKEEGILIDLLVYLGGNTLENDEKTQPPHVVHIVNILAAGCIWNGTTMDRADNRHFTNVWHFGSPTHPKTREILANELAVVAARVPYVEKVPPLPLEYENEIPMPRRLTPEQVRQMSTEVPSDWNFLASRTANTDAPPPALARPSGKPAGQRVPFAIGP
jgi:pimeloyl-ACP methyl ester carboxylesterase